MNILLPPLLKLTLHKCAGMFKFDVRFFDSIDRVAKAEPRIVAHGLDDGHGVVVHQRADTPNEVVISPSASSYARLMRFEIVSTITSSSHSLLALSVLPDCAPCYGMHHTVW